MTTGVGLPVANPLDPELTNRSREISERLCHEVEVCLAGLGVLGIIVIPSPGVSCYWRADHPDLKLRISFDRVRRQEVLTIYGNDDREDVLTPLVAHLRDALGIHTVSPQTKN
jgi:hypothetical protein